MLRRRDILRTCGAIYRIFTEKCGIEYFRTVILSINESRLFMPSQMRDFSDLKPIKSASLV